MTGTGNGSRGALYIIVLVSVLHLVWAGLLISSATAAHSTPVAAVVAVTGSRAAAAGALASTGLLALFTGWLHGSPHRIRPWLRVAGLVPQQFFLVASAASGVMAAVHGHYADGVPRPWQFILGDQLPVVLVALLYATAIVVVSRPGPARRA